MADADLDELRKARLAQLQQQGGSSSGGSGLPAGLSSGGGGDGDDQKKAESEARQSILSQILEPEAADRLGRIRLVKESRAHDVESRLIMLARSGQLRARVSEKQLKEILEALTEQQEKSGGGGGGAGKVVISRRRAAWSDEDELDDL